MSGATYPLHEVLRLTGLTHRAVRYYVQLRLVPGAKPRGVATRYSHEQLLRLRAIRLLRTRDRLGLAAIRRRLAGMTVDALEAMLAAAAPPAAPAPTVEDPRPSLGMRWDRVPLLPGLELHVRSDAGALVLRLAQEILDRYGATPPSDVS